MVWAITMMVEGITVLAQEVTEGKSFLCWSLCGPLPQLPTPPLLLPPPPLLSPAPQRSPVHDVAYRYMGEVTTVLAQQAAEGVQVSFMLVSVCSSSSFPLPQHLPMVSAIIMR